jgi:hypothetical protein
MAAKETSKTPADAPPKDFSPAMPKQLREQMAAADAIRADMVGQPQPAPEEQQQGDPQQPDQPPQPTHPTPQPQPAPKPQPTPQQGDQSQEEPSWEQRFNSLRGRYDQAAQTNSALAQRLEQMEQLIATMKIRGAEEANSYAPPAELQPLRLVTPEEAADYGDEFLTVVGKRSREELLPEVEALRNEIGQLKGRLEGVGTVMERGEQQKVYGSLAAAVPNWREINTDQGFKDWLSVPDPFSGQPRKKLLLDAFARHEGDRVVQFFKGFLAEATDTPPNTQSPGNAAPPLPGNGQGSGRPSLESFAAPGRARSAPQALSPDKPIYTSAQIARFMADKLTGKYRGREADADAIERDIYQAQHEGRIQ